MKKLCFTILTLWLTVSLLFSQNSADVDDARSLIKSGEFKKVIDRYKLKYKKRNCTPDEYKLYAIARLKTYQSDIITRRLIDRLMGDNLRHARFALNEAIKANTEDIETKFFLGIYFSVEGKDDKAIAYLRQVFNSEPAFHTYAYGDVVTELMQLYAKHEDFESIKALHEEKLAADPGDAWSKVQLAISYGILGDDRKMTELFNEGIKGFTRIEQADKLFEDFKLLATSDETEKWELLKDIKDKTSFIRTFWKKRDPNLFDEHNDAMIQFYKRLFYARSVYHQQADPGYDDRGMIYIRFGRPDRIFFGGGDSNIRPNETWVYYYLENGMHFDFILMGTHYELRLLGDAVIMIGAKAGEMGLKELMGERSSIHPFYAGIYQKMYLGRYSPWDTESSYDYLSDFEKMTEYAKKQYFAYNDSTAPIFANARAAFFKESKGKTRLDFYYMIPYNQLTFLEGTEGNKKESYLSVTMKVLDPRSYDELITVEHADTITADSTQQQSFVFVDEFRQSLIPGNYLVAFQLSNNNKKKLNRYQFEFNFKEYSADTLQVSDIQLALSADRIDEPSRFIKPHSDIKVVPNPSARWVKSQTLTLYYEIYNLTLNNEGESSYEISYRITMQNYGKSIFRMIGDLFSKRKEVPQIVQTTSKRGPSTTEREYISFDISDLLPGDAVLQVLVRDLLSQRQSRSAVNMKIGEPRDK